MISLDKRFFHIMALSKRMRTNYNGNKTIKYRGKTSISLTQRGSYSRTDENSSDVCIMPIIIFSQIAVSFTD